MQRHITSRVLVAAAVALALQATAHAADDPAAADAGLPAAGTTQELETLVVTARRRSEAVQDVPVAVSVRRPQLCVLRRSARGRPRSACVRCGR